MDFSLSIETRKFLNSTAASNGHIPATSTQMAFSIPVVHQTQLILISSTSITRPPTLLCPEPIRLCPDYLLNRRAHHASRLHLLVPTRPHILTTRHPRPVLGMRLRRVPRADRLLPRRVSARGALDAHAEPEVGPQLRAVARGPVAVHGAPLSDW